MRSVWRRRTDVIRDRTVRPLVGRSILSTCCCCCCCCCFHYYHTIIIMNSWTRLCFLFGIGFCSVVRANISIRDALWGHYCHPTTSTTLEYQQQQPQVDLGTTLVAVRYNQGVVVAADSRTSVGTYVSNRYAHKLAPITRHCMVLRSGSAADTQHVATACRDFVRARKLRFGGNEMTVTHIAHWMQQAVRQQPAGQVSLLVAGYDEEQCVGCIFSVALSGALQEEGEFCAAGSGSVFILGFLDHEIHHRQQVKERGTDSDETTTNRSNLTETRAIELCQRAIALAAQRDGSSGGVARLAVINRDGTRYLDAKPAVLSSSADDDDNGSSRGNVGKGHLPGFAPPTITGGGS